MFQKYAILVSRKGGIAIGQLENLLRLGLSEAEAKQVLEDDKRIDRGEKMDFDLNEQQTKETRKYRQADKKPFVPNLKPRERKPNEAKRAIMKTLIDAVSSLTDEVEITNPERQIDFTVDGTRYRIVFSAPRKQGALNIYTFFCLSRSCPGAAGSPRAVFQQNHQFTKK